MIVNQRGLHARAAAKFVRVAEDRGAGTELVLRAEGADAADAVAALADLIERGFDE